MQGRRREEVADFRPGDYAFQDGIVWFMDPVGNVGNTDQRWTVTEHEDKTVTVVPSLHVKRGLPTEWHGYLERGVWRKA